jgi:hypothetical protein
MRHPLFLIVEALLVVAMVLSGVVQPKVIVDMLLSIVRLVVRALMVIVRLIRVPVVVLRVLPVPRVPVVRNGDTVEQQTVIVELAVKEVTVLVGQQNNHLNHRLEHQTHDEDINNLFFKRLKAGVFYF